MTPVELVLWGFAIGGAIGAAVVGFLWVCAMFGVEWESRVGKGP